MPGDGQNTLDFTITKDSATDYAMDGNFVIASTALTPNFKLNAACANGNTAYTVGLNPLSPTEYTYVIGAEAVSIKNPVHYATDQSSCSDWSARTYVTDITSNYPSSDLFAWSVDYEDGSPDISVYATDAALAGIHTYTVTTYVDNKWYSYTFKITATVELPEEVTIVKNLGPPLFFDPLQPQFTEVT